jgi:hypothetical protein
MYTNSYIFGSSRGRSMRQVKCKHVNILPGGTYSKLCDLAEKQLRNNTDPKIVYLIAGIPDICTLTQDKKQKYEESYLNLEKDHVLHVQNTISDVEKRMRIIGCKVVFGTITTISFKNWNSHRTFVGKTVHLKHEAEYHIMQEQLNSILYTVNSYIINKNRENGVVSPFLHSYVHKRNGKKTRYIYTRLVDGVHPTHALSAAGKHHLEATIDVNENNLNL